MGLKQIVEASLKLVKLPAGKLVLAVLLISNAVQLNFSIQNRIDGKQCEIRLYNETKDKDSVVFYYTEKVDAIRKDYSSKLVDFLEDYNKKIEKQTEELKEENKIKRTTLKNLRKK